MVCRARASGRELVPGVQWSAAWEVGRSSAQTVTEPLMVGSRLLARVWNKARAQGAFVEGWVSSRAHRLSQRQLRAVMGGAGCRRRQRGARPAAGSGGGPADTGTSRLGGFAWQVRGEVWAVGEERGGAGDPVCHLLALATPFVLANSAGVVAGGSGLSRSPASPAFLPAAGAVCPGATGDGAGASEKAFALYHNRGKRRGRDRVSRCSHSPLPAWLEPECDVRSQAAVLGHEARAGG